MKYEELNNRSSSEGNANHKVTGVIYFIYGEILRLCSISNIF